MDTNTIWKVLEVAFIGVSAAAMVTVIFRAKNAALHERITKVEDKYSELSVECLRRHDIDPVRNDIADLRRRIDDLITLQTKRK